MECKNCQSDMDLVGIYGDGYIEPREEEFICPNCGTRCFINQAYGEEWQDV